MFEIKYESSKRSVCCPHLPVVGPKNSTLSVGVTVIRNTTSAIGPR